MTAPVRGAMSADLRDGALALLKAGRQALVDTGWVQGVYEKYDGVTEDAQCVGYCAIGALGAGLRSTDVNDSAYSTAYWALNHQLPGGFITVPRWNDQVGRTAEEVLALYDKAIAEVEAL